MKLFAEIGLNHLGNDRLAISMVKSCLTANLEGITLQIQPHDYYNNKKNFRRKLKKSTYKKIYTIVKKKKKLFGLALMDENTFEDFKDIKIDFIKILSTAFHNNNLIQKIYKKKIKIFLSTGIANLREIKKIGKVYSKIDFIHTTLSNKTKNANLLAITNLKKNMKNSISFGHHSINSNILLGAAALLPKNIFFYVKPNKISYYPDNEHAIKLKYLNKIISKIRLIENSLGDGVKSKKKIPKWVFE